MRQHFAALESARHALVGHLKNTFFNNSRMSSIVYPTHGNVTQTRVAAGVCTPLKGQTHGKQARFIKQHFTNNLFANLYRERGLQPQNCAPQHGALPQEEWSLYDHTSCETSTTYHAWKLCAGEDMR